MLLLVLKFKKKALISSLPYSKALFRTDLEFALVAAFSELGRFPADRARSPSLLPQKENSFEKFAVACLEILKMKKLQIKPSARTLI